MEELREKVPFHCIIGPTNCGKTTIIGLAAGVGYIAKKIIKEPFINDPSSSITNYAKWVVVLSGSIYLKDYLEHKRFYQNQLKDVRSLLINGNHSNDDWRSYLECDHLCWWILSS